jgi:hypothetical protein
VTRRRNPPPRNPLRPQRSSKDKDQLDSELRMARANRRAENLQKQKLRRLDWDPEAEDSNLEPGDLDPETTEDAAAEDADEDDTGRSQ